LAIWDASTAIRKTTHYPNFDHLTEGVGDCQHDDNEKTEGRNRVLDYDVVIIGCGPVGGLAANLLGKAGVRTLVVERVAEPHPLPRAVHIDHEVMRLFQSAGLVDRVSPLMRDTQGHMHIGADGGVIRYMGTAGRPRPFGWSGDYFFYQPELEAVLREGLGRFAEIDLRLGVECLGIDQDDRGVRLRLAAPEGETVVSARWVIACDGASSPTRKALGVVLDDLGFEEPWLVVDAEVDGPLVFPGFHHVPEGADLQQLSIMLCDPRRPATIVPGRGNHRRWEFMLLPGEDESTLDADAVEALVAPWVGSAPSRIVRATTYRFHGLIAETWKVGRVFLAGDAAHQTPPFFGQGMCHGMRDVANLAWKLEKVLSGGAPDALLDGYQQEREPQVRSVIASAVEAGRYICMLDPVRAAERDAEMRARQGDPVRTAADLITPIRGLTLDSPGAGKRFIQPRVRHEGQDQLLDDATGGGLVMLLRGEEARVEPAVARPLGIRQFRIGMDLEDVAGDLGLWLDEHQADAVLLRPDFYVFGTASGPGGASALLRAFDRAVATEETLCPA
jgi:3-(3-hydroxy-phenyl)propionate hydroxylase